MFKPRYLNFTFSAYLPRRHVINKATIFLTIFRHRRWLRAMAYVFTLCTSIVRFLHSVRPRSLAGPRPHGGCAETVRKSCDFGAAVIWSPQPRHGYRRVALQRWHGDCSVYYFSGFINFLNKARSGQTANVPDQTRANCTLFPTRLIFWIHKVPVSTCVSLDGKAR